MIALKPTDFRGIGVTARLRDETASRLLDTEEFQRRTAIESAESERRLLHFNDDMLLLLCAKLRNINRPVLHPEDEWERRTRCAFETAETEHVEAASATYTPYGLYWMPHDTLRDLHAEWQVFYNKWKRNESVAASSLLSSFFCVMLVDENLEESDAIRTSRFVMESCLEVTNDWEDDAIEAVPYYTFVALIRTFSAALFPTKHPYIAMHLMTVVLSDRIHRTH